MDRRRDRGDLEFLPGDRVTSPEIKRRLWILFGWKLVVQDAKNFLVGRNLVRSPRDLPGYYDFAKRVYFHIRDFGFEGAVPLVEADADQFELWGFSEPVLQSLALLQGLVVEV